MGDHKILEFKWRETSIDLKVEIDKCTLLDLVVEFEDEAKKRGSRLDFAYPTFGYAYEMSHKKLETDTDLMTMFQRLQAKNPIPIWVGTVMKPSPLYKLVLGLRRRNEAAKKSVRVDDTVEYDNHSENYSDDLPVLRVSTPL